MMTRKFLLVLGCVLAAAVGLAGWSVHAKREARAALAGVNERRVELAARLQHASECQTKAERAVAVASDRANALGQGGGKTSAGAPEAALSDDARQERKRAAIDKDPALQNRVLSWQRAELLERYRAFFRMMKLSTEEIGLLGDAWAGDLIAAMDLSALMKDRKMAATDPAIAAQRAQHNEELLAVEDAVLGAEGREKLARYKRTQPMREVVGRMASKAALGGTPINAEQLVEVLAESDPKFRSGSEASPGQINWEAAGSAAKAILGAMQYEVFVIEGEASKAADALSSALASARRADAAKSPKAEGSR